MSDDTRAQLFVCSAVCQCFLPFILVAILLRFTSRSSDGDHPGIYLDCLLLAIFPVSEAAIRSSYLSSTTNNASNNSSTTESNPSNNKQSDFYHVLSHWWTSNLCLFSCYAGYMDYTTNPNWSLKNTNVALMLSACAAFTLLKVGVVIKDILDYCKQPDQPLLPTPN